MMKRLAALLCLMTVAGLTYAELPPGSYDKLRAEADDALVIQVTGVNVDTKSTAREVTVQAKVLGVERSKSGLKKGDNITFNYRISTVQVPGPRPIPLLVKGDVYPAFLKTMGKSLEPAAYGESFKMTPEAVGR